MRHIFTALVAAIEAVMIALVGVVCIAIPTLLVGVVTLALGVDVITLGRVIAAVWVLSHGGAMHLRLDEVAAVHLGLAPEAMSFDLTLSPLLIALVTGFLAWRMGRRFSSDFSTGVAAVTGGSLGFAAASLMLTVLAGDFIEQSAWLGALTATLWFVIPAWIGLFTHHGDVVSTAWFRLKVRAEQSGAPKFGWAFEKYVARTLTLTVALMSALIFVGAVAVTFALAFSFVDIVSLTQSMQLDVIGGLVFFVGQLLYLPVFIVWAISWLSGAGFTLGAGSSVTPFETLLGPLPSVPVLAALPEGWGAWGFLSVLIVVLTGAAIGALFGHHPEYRAPSWWRLIVVVGAASLLTALSVALGGVLASGAAGPGRMQLIGPDAWLTAGLVAGELFVGVLAGMALRRSAAPDPRLTPPRASSEYLELVSAPAPAQPRAATISAPAPPRPAVESSVSDSGDTVPLVDHGELLLDTDLADEVAHGLEDPRFDDAETNEDDEHATAEISRFPSSSRIADPEDDASQPWFRKAARPRKRRTRSAKPMFSEEELLEEFSWESRPHDHEEP